MVFHALNETQAFPIFRSAAYRGVAAHFRISNARQDTSDAILIPHSSSVFWKLLF
jgi:hypothetical protein